MTKIAVITSTRADYGLLAPLIKALHHHPKIGIRIIATGTHLSELHGLTINEILADGFSVDAQIPFDMSSDQRQDLTHASGRFTQDLVDHLSKMQPDAMIILGDRFEILPAAYSAAMLNIKTIHLHGGEVTLGAIDNKIRYAISHLADLHITATEQSKQRLIDGGINPDHVFMTGALGVENAVKMPKASRSEIETKTGAVFCEQNILFTFHPETVTTFSVEKQIDTVIDALKNFEHIGTFISMPNADPGNRVIREKLSAFAKHHPHAYLTENLGHYLYLSLMNEVDAVVGNSSSGIIEAPAFGVTTINIGDRQKGREQAKTVRQCGYDSAQITSALTAALSQPIAAELSAHPYYQDETCNKVVSIIEQYFAC